MNVSFLYLLEQTLSKLMPSPLEEGFVWVLDDKVMLHLTTTVSRKIAYLFFSYSYVNCKMIKCELMFSCCSAFFSFCQNKDAVDMFFFVSF